MTQEDAEEIVSNPQGHPAFRVIAARKILGVPSPLAITTICDLCAKQAASEGDHKAHAVYSEILTAIGEAKMKIASIAARCEDDDGHIVHALNDVFGDM